MEIQELAISKIKPDPNQPRQKINHERVEDMAKSIRTEGVINPIEVDAKNIIITGEMRWRAAKIAGLETVPCKVIKISPNERFRRQVIENIHHNTMSDWDTAQALAKLLHLLRGGKLQKMKQGEDAGVNKLSKQIGKSRWYITEHLRLLQSSQKLQKAVKEDQISFGYARIVQRVSDDIRPGMEKKILSKEFKTSDGAAAVVVALNQAPDKAQEIMAVDYSKYSTVGEVVTKLSTIVPSLSVQIAKSFTPSQELATIRRHLKEWLEKNPKEDVGKIHEAQIIATLSGMVAAIERWVK